MNRKPRIVLLNPTCLDVLDAQRDWIASLDVDLVTDESYRSLRIEDVDGIFAGADGLILPASVRSLPWPEHMERHANLRVLSIAASGYDWLDLDAATRNGIVVTKATPPEGVEVVADMTFGLMLAVARQIPHHDALLREGKYERGLGTMVWRKTLGIVGLGQIGKAVARRARGFDMQILAATPRPDLEFVRRFEITVVSLEEVLRRSDFVSLHVRLDPTTKGLIGKRELDWMKPSAFLINTARTQLVDETALTEALVAYRLAGAAIDDPPEMKNSPLIQLPNFVCTPHLGNRAIEGVNAVFRDAIQNAIAVLRGEKPGTVVNPSVFGSPRLRIGEI